MGEEMRECARGRVGITEKQGESTEAMAERCGEWEMQWASYQSTRSIRGAWTEGPVCMCVCACVILHLLFRSLQFYENIY